jgi:hypothetical protein
MKYSAAQVAKSLVAFGVATIGAATAAAGGADLSVLDPGQWMIAIGAGLTAGGGVFVTPNQSSNSATDMVVAGIPVVVAQAAEAQANLDKVRQSAADALGELPVFGDAAKQIINSLPRF